MFARELRGPLYSNSLFVMLSSITNAGSGFFFRMIAAVKVKNTEFK